MKVEGAREDMLIHVTLFGSPYRLKPENWVGSTPEKGASLWLSDPQLVRQKGKPALLIARQILTVSPEGK
jgi:hypothetical protein